MVSLVSRPLNPRERTSVNCDAGVAVGDLVYITGDAVGGRYQVARADAFDFSKMPVVGAIVGKTSSTQATVQWTGEIRGIYSSMTPGRLYFLSSAGTPSLVPPVPSGGNPQAHIQAVGVALTPTILMLALQGVTRRVL